MKIGIFGGSFNPIHKRHEEMALFLLDGYVDKIIFVPTGSKYEYKNNLIDNKYRLDMIKLVIDKNMAHKRPKTIEILILFFIKILLTIFLH